LHNPDPHISTTISDSEGYDYGNPIIVEDSGSGSSERLAYEVFFIAKCWLETFVRDWKVFCEEPFIPSGDSNSVELGDRLRQIAGESRQKPST
jgi:hypothetical protein